MKVLVENVQFLEYEKIIITLRLKSGALMGVRSKLYEDGDIRDFIGKEIEVLLRCLRAPIVEYRNLPNNQSPFELESKFMQFDTLSQLERQIRGDNKPVKWAGIIFEGTFIPNYIPDPTWDFDLWFKDTINGTPAFETEDGIFLLENWFLDKRIPLEKFPERFFMAFSITHMLWRVEGQERKKLVRKPLYENKDKSFRIFMKEVEVTSPYSLQAYIELHLGNTCLVYHPIYFVHIGVLAKGITEDIRDEYIMVRGCGEIGCCAGLYWNLIHEGEYIYISNIRWSRGQGYPVEEQIEGQFKVPLEEYRWEVLKLKELCENVSKERIDKLIDDTHAQTSQEKMDWVDRQVIEQGVMINQALDLYKDREEEFRIAFFQKFIGISELQSAYQYKLISREIFIKESLIKRGEAFIKFMRELLN